MIGTIDGRIYTLRPCPFCGMDEAEFTNCQELEVCETARKCPEKSHWFAVVCSCYRGGCGASSGFAETREKAAERWNRRR